MVHDEAKTRKEERIKTSLNITNIIWRVTYRAFALVLYRTLVMFSGY